MKKRSRTEIAKAIKDLARVHHTSYCIPFRTVLVYAGGEALQEVAFLHKFYCAPASTIHVTQIIKTVRLFLQNECDLYGWACDSQIIYPNKSYRTCDAHLKGVELETASLTFTLIWVQDSDCLRH